MVNENFIKFCLTIFIINIGYMEINIMHKTNFQHFLSIFLFLQLIELKNTGEGREMLTDIGMTLAILQFKSN